MTTAEAGRPREGRLGAGRWIEAAQPPGATVTSVHQLTTSDGATVSGVLRTVPGARTVVCLMHPRQDVTHHVLVPELLMRGFAVWTQGTRSVNNDLSLVHEQALLDAAAGQVFLRGRDFAAVVTLGHSGGGTLFAFYGQQAALPGGERIATTPAGRPAGLAGAEMPVPDGSVFMAPHPGQGELLLRLIDPSVTDEGDPLSADPELDPYDPANGFVAGPRQLALRPRSSSRATARRSTTGSPASTRRPGGGPRTPRTPAVPSSGPGIRPTAAARWRPGSSRSTAATLTCAASISRWTLTTARTAPSSAAVPTSPTTAWSDSAGSRRPTPGCQPGPPAAPTPASCAARRGLPARCCWSS